MTTTRSFFLEDYPKTLFPLATNRILAEHGAAELAKEVERAAENVMRKKEGSKKGEKEEYMASFLPQTKVYASKKGLHLRRTVKLDPVAEYFIYDFAFKNKKIFTRPKSESRRTFGYHFFEGSAIKPTLSYRAFKTASSQARKNYAHFIKFDIASYFNSVYHHDLVQWLEAKEIDEATHELFGGFLRDINSGRSIDCLPQGLFPTKAIGNAFLSFLDKSTKIKSSLMLRFMDDVIFFDDNQSTVMSDFITAQEILGNKGLSVNPQKTATSGENFDSLEEDMDEVKKQLLNRRREIIVESDYDKEIIIEEGVLTEEEVGYLKEMLQSDHISEEDAELILTLMREFSTDVLEKFEELYVIFQILRKISIIFAEILTTRTSSVRPSSES